MPTRIAPSTPLISTRERSISAWIRAYPYLLGFAVTCLVLGVLVVRKKRETEFEWVYILSSRHLLTGDGLYGLTTAPFLSFTYPPCMAILGLPFDWLPRVPGRIAWYLVNVASLLALWCGAWKLSGGGRLQGIGVRVDRKGHIVAGLGLAVAVPYLLSGMDHQQTDNLIAALLIGGALALSRSRGLLAATLFGLAAGMKCTPLLWAPYLAWRRRPGAAIWLVLVAIGVNLLPDLIHARPGGGLWLVDWFERYLLPMGRSDALPGKWYAWILDNQSLAGLATRWGTTQLHRSADGLAVVDRPDPLGPATLRPIVFAVQGALLLASGWGLRRSANRDASPRSLREPAEYGMVLLLMLLLSPMSSRPHFGTMLLPALVVARLAVVEGRIALRAWLIAAIVAGLAAAPLWGRDVARLSMWCGLISWSAASLLSATFLAILSDATVRAVGAAPGRAVGHPAPNRRPALMGAGA